MSIDISSRQSYLANLVRKKNLKSGIALNIILLNSAWFLGPNIGIYFMNFLVLENLYFVFGNVNTILQDLPITVQIYYDTTLVDVGICTNKCCKFNFSYQNA